MGAGLRIPQRLRETCAAARAASAWLADLPAAVAELERRWSLALGGPFEGEDGTCAWVAPAKRADGADVVLKLGLPHFESEHEAEGLRVWNGDGAVRLLDSDESLGALLLERCLPGTSLRELPEPEQDAVIAGLLCRLWRPPPPGCRFRPLSEMLAHRSKGVLERSQAWPDPGLVREGLRLYAELPRSAPQQVLLATDLHAGNVLRAQREPWLAIDPKPFVGDPAYDATQLLLNRRAAVAADPERAIRGLADRLGVSRERVWLWTFARAALRSPQADWLKLARALARAL